MFKQNYIVHCSQHHNACSSADLLYSNFHSKSTTSLKIGTTTVHTALLICHACLNENVMGWFLNIRFFRLRLHLKLMQGSDCLRITYSLIVNHLL